jgi:hypothetical protein
LCVVEISGGAVITCTYEWCVQVVNKCVHQSIPLLWSPLNRDNILCNIYPPWTARSSEIWLRVVWWTFTYFSKDGTASIFRVEGFAKEVFNKSQSTSKVLWLYVADCFAYSSAVWGSIFLQKASVRSLPSVGAVTAPTQHTTVVRVALLRLSRSDPNFYLTWEWNSQTAASCWTDLCIAFCACMWILGTSAMGVRCM